MVYKSVRQMHIDVRVQLQQLAANRSRKLSDGLIDWALNQSQDQLIANCVIPKTDGTPRFEINRERREEISALIVLLHGVSAGKTEEGNFVARLPANMLYLLVDSCSVGLVCNNSTIIGSYEVEKITSVQLPLSTKVSAPYYTIVQVLYNNELIFDLSQIEAKEETGYTGMDAISDHFYIRDLITSTLNSKGYNVYWERTGSTYEAGRLVFITKNTAPTIVVKLDGGTYTGTTVENTLTLQSISGSHISMPNSMMAPDKVPFAEATPYFKSSYISPVSQLQNGQIIVMGHKSFIVSKLYLTYIRKPAQISLTLGQDSELSAAAHQAICDMTVEKLQQRIGDPKWQDTAAANLVNKNS